MPTTTMSNKSPTHRVKNVDNIEDSRIKREENRKKLSRLLNPVSMSAEHNEGVRNYPTSGWQDEGSTGRWSGFRVFWGTYKVVSDKDHALRFLTYIPESVADESCPLLISWHGGGFFTGAADYVPWDAQHVADLAREVKAIAVSFNYRLLPYVNGNGLLSDVKDALAYIHNEGGLQAFVQKEVPSVKIDWRRVMVVGESAGGFLAAYTWLKSPVPLNAVYLRYPMLAQYHREPRDYGGVSISEEHYAAMAEAVMDEVERIEEAGEDMPVESSLHPPMNMPAANIFSSTDKWKDIFKHPDILTILKDQKGRPESCPKVFIVHGEQDAACPIGNSIAFKEEIDKREWANGKVDLVTVPNMDHGFDYNLKPEMKGCNWLRELVSRVKEAWISQ